MGCGPPAAPRTFACPAAAPVTKLAALAVLIAALPGCSLFAEEGLDRTFLLPVVALDVPETAAVGEPFTVIMTAQITNECITNEGTEVDRQGDQLSVAVVGRERVRPGDECAVQIRDVEARVDHVPETPGELLVVARGYNGPVQATVRVE